MDKILVKGLYSDSRILIGERLANVNRYLPPDKQVFILTDQNLVRFHAPLFPDLPTYAIIPGEGSKTMDSVVGVQRWLIEHGAGRNAFLLGIGGGVVCDLAGFVASTYLRGIDFGFVASSLLAQVDASTGGKNGVNLDGYKNIIGTFNQPAFVLCDPSLLQTLPPAEFRNGMAEAIKHALIADYSLLEMIEQHLGRILSLDPEALNALIGRCVRIKAEIVGADEREKGLRRKLNLGHTLGHALEKTTGLSHGEAISVGMAFASALSVKKGLQSPEEQARVCSLLKQAGLPVYAKAAPDKVMEAMLRDKKKQDDNIHFVLLKGIGEAVVTPVSLEELRAFGGKWINKANSQQR